MNYPDKKTVEESRGQYTAGTVVILDKMVDEQAPPIGTAGVVTSVDDIGTIHVDWLTGSTLGIAYEEDECHIATPHEAALYYINKEAKEQHDGSYCPRCGDEMPGSLHTHAVSRRASIIVCDMCGVKESLEDAVQAGVMKGEAPLPIEDWYIVKKNAGGKHPYHIEATEEIEDGVVIGYTVTVPERPGAIAHCDKPNEILATGESLMEK
ncbi:MAG: DUF4314 domain-containing protein [Lachnospiraceae bacterium]|nr:DUF4314 domain-containing protein [Lachnospiraceae bacterium]